MSEEQLQIIGAGFGRTGTNSLKVALNILGYKTYHMTELEEHEDQLLWYKQMNNLKKSYIKYHKMK